MKRMISTIGIAAGFSLMGVALVQAENITETRDLTSFEKIIIKNTGVGIDVEVGKEFSVTLKGSEKWVGRITTKVEDNALVVGQMEKKKKSINFDSDDRIIITMPEFTSLKVDGAVDADISGVDSASVEFKINGAGNIEVSGKCGKLKVEIDGAGNFEGQDLKCEDIKVGINGAGNAEVYGSKSANLDINGFGNIDLYGNPSEINKDKTIFSNITIHKE